MSWKVFIDGEAGTTGLQIRDRLSGRDDVSLIQIDPSARKSLSARLAAYREADIAILCLPDGAAREIVGQTGDLDVRLIDASTAHRVHPDWVFGFPELGEERRERIRNARLLSNPGCYSTGAIALLNPLVEAGIILPDTFLSIHAVSGYSGGGRDLIAEFEAGRTAPFFSYSLDQKHKHLPEIMALGGLTVQPAFSPSVGAFAQGMIVQIPLPLHRGQGLDALKRALEDRYDNASFVRVVPAELYGGRIDPTGLNGTNVLELSVHGDERSGCAVLVALLDNLGKGASGAAVQNLNIMLGVDEAESLRDCRPLATTAPGSPLPGC